MGTPWLAAKARAEILSPISAIVSASGPMKVDSGVRGRPCKTGVFGEETVARMDGVGSRRKGGLDDLRCVEMRTDRRFSKNFDGLIGHADMPALRFDRVMDRDGSNAEIAQGAHHAAGNLASVGYEDFSEGDGFFLGHGLAALAIARFLFRPIRPAGCQAPARWPER